MKPNKKLVIFDWDGTLMDSIGRIVSSMQNAAQKAAVPVPDEATAASVIGLSLDKAIETLFPNQDAQTRQRLFDLYRQEYIELNTTATPLFEDALTCLQLFRDNGYLLAVATGKARAGLQRAMDSVGLTDFFDTSICADESESKPSPAMLLTVLERFSLSSDDAIMIGDSVHDLKMAQAAGMASIGVTMGADCAERLAQFSPIAVVDSLTELATLFSFPALELTTD